MEAAISGSCVRVFLFGFQSLWEAALEEEDLNNVMMKLMGVPAAAVFH